MRRRLLLIILLVGLVGAAVVAIAQPPTTPTTPPPPVVVVPPAGAFPPGPPRTPAVVPVTSAPSVQPASSSDVPLSRFTPLESQPHPTQSAVRAVLLGATWMTRMNQVQGRFMAGYNPSLRQPISGDQDMRQARAALALAQAAKFCGDEKQAAMANQTILTLLASTKLDPADPNCRVPIHSSVRCNRVGFAALVALAIYELPAPEAKLVAEAEKLCCFLKKQCRPDGSVHFTDGASDDPAKTDPVGMNEYPGLALQAIISGNRLQPDRWKTEVTKKGIEFFRAKFKANAHPLLAATLSPVCSELYLQTKTNEAAVALFEMNDWLCGLQIAANDMRTPQWAGGFRTIMDGQVVDVPPGPEVGLYMQSLACAYEINRHVPDLARETRYKTALLDSSQFLCGLQYVEANTRHFENSFRANMLIGGFHLSPVDGNLRIDATATAITGMLRFLASGAEK
jgi:hypothetical protein